MSVYKVCVVGDAQSGKTSLIRALMGLQHDEAYTQTASVDINPVRIITNRGTHTINFHDVGSLDGGELHRHVHFTNADGYIIMTDANEMASLQRLPHESIMRWYKEINRTTPNAKVSFVMGRDDDRIVANSIDSNDGKVRLFSTSVYTRTSLIGPINDIMKKMTGDEDLKVFSIGDGPPRYLTEERPTKKRRLSIS